MKLEKKYWQDCYADPETMDGITNAKEHATYLHSFFALEQVKVKSIIDLGFGTGHLLKAFNKVFGPKCGMGIEPSKYIFDKFRQNGLGKKFELHNVSIQQWCESEEFDEVWDLGVCTSVFQYIKTPDLEKILPVLASRMKYLYFSVPTNKELNRQVQEMEFHDQYALRRSKKKYHELISKYFTIVGSRVLESKKFYSEKNSHFSEFLFRF